MILPPRGIPLSFTATRSGASSPAAAAASAADAADSVYAFAAAACCASASATPALSCRWYSARMRPHAAFDITHGAAAASAPSAPSAPAWWRCTATSAASAVVNSTNAVVRRACCRGSETKAIAPQPPSSAFTASIVAPAGSRSTYTVRASESSFVGSRARRHTRSPSSETRSSGSARSAVTTGVVVSAAPSVSSFTRLNEASTDISTSPVPFGPTCCCRKRSRRRLASLK